MFNLKLFSLHCKLVSVVEQMGLSVALSRNAVTWLILKRQKRLRYLEKRMTIDNSMLLFVEKTKNWFDVRYSTLNIQNLNVEYRTSNQFLIALLLLSLLLLLVVC